MQSTKFSLKSKLISALLALLLVFTFTAPTAIRAFVASASVSEWTELEVSQIKNQYDVGSTITLPTVAGASMLVKNPRGEDITSTLSSGTFTASIAGQYQISYTKGDATTGIIYINVVASDVSFDFAANTDKIIPSKIKTNTTVSFPNPSILDEEGDVIDGATATITLKKDGQAVELTTTDGNKSYVFASIGDYELTYTYQSVGTAKITKKYSIEVVEEMTTEFDISYNLKSSMPTTAVQGVETTLPQVTGKDKDGNTIDVYTVITVNHEASDGTLTPMTVKDFKFTPKLAGNYVVKYTVTDFYGNKTEQTYNITDVADTKVPTIQVVEDYTVTTVEGKKTVAEDFEPVEVKYAFPSKIATGTEIEVPAIYASDNVSGYGDLTLTRRIKNGSTIVKTFEQIAEGETEPEFDPNETATYTFEKAGTYTVVYTASDGTNTTSDSQMSFTIVVEDNFSDTVAPTITVTDFVKDKNNKTIYEVKPDQKYKVAVPSVIDYVDPTDASNTSVSDKNPQLSVYAYVTSAGETTKEELTLSDDGNYYEGVVPTTADGTLTIVYEAVDFFGNTNEITKTIDVINTNDTTAPTFLTDFDSLDVITADQYDEVSLWEVVAQDTSDKNLSLSITVTAPNGKTVDLYDYEKQTIAQDVGSQATATAKFVANLAGEYTVNYVAKDAGGNYTVEATKITVISKASPVIVLSDYETTQELGSVVIPQAFVYVDNQIVEDAIITKKIIGDTTLNNSVVKVEYTATYNNQTSETLTATFTVKDTIKPVITFDEEMDLYAPLNKVDGSNPVKYQPITIPAWSISDTGTGVDFDSISISVVNNKGNTIQLVDPADSTKSVDKITGSASQSAFIPTGDGKYTVTFKASDLAGNQTTETRTIAVGDTVAPTITISNESSIPTSATLKDGKYTLSLTVNSDTVKIVDAKDGNLDIADHLTVTVTSPSGTTISADDGSDYNYTLSEAGTYTIKYVAVDEAGNETTKTFSLTVSANEGSNTTVTEVLGTVLLVVAIIVLIGVIWFFVKPARKPKTAKKEEDKENK